MSRNTGVTKRHCSLQWSVVRSISEPSLPRIAACLPTQLNSRCPRAAANHTRGEAITRAIDNNIMCRGICISWGTFRTVVLLVCGDESILKRDRSAPVHGLCRNQHNHVREFVHICTFIVLFSALVTVS